MFFRANSGNIKQPGKGAMRKRGAVGPRAAQFATLRVFTKAERSLLSWKALPVIRVPWHYHTKRTITSLFEKASN